MIRFAIQAKNHEVIGSVMEVIARAGAQLGLGFKRIEALEWISVAAQRMLLVQGDLQEGDDAKLLDLILKEGRGVVGRSGVKYIARINGKTGPVPLTTMLAAPRLTGVKPFRGPGDPFWERQFSRG